MAPSAILPGKSMWFGDGVLWTHCNKKKNLTKPFHTCCLALASRWSGGKRTFQFAASQLHLFDLTFSKNTCVPVCPAWSAAISSPGIPNNQQNTSTSIWIDTNTTAKHVNLALRFGFQQWPSLVDFYTCHFPSLECSSSVIFAFKIARGLENICCTHLCTAQGISKKDIKIDTNRLQTYSASQMLVPPSRWDLSVHQSSWSSLSLEPMTLRVFQGF